MRDLSRRDWWRDGVLYQIYPRSFADASGDGIGDLPGILGKLDYLEWLGIDCLWLLPFYPSPMRDGGYDISDFFTVHADLGYLDDLVEFLDDAHRRGIRVSAVLAAISMIPANTVTAAPRTLRRIRGDGQK